MAKTIISEKLKKALLKLKLTEKEVLAYSALLEKGASSVQDIARFAGMNRVTTYAAIDKLKKRGLIAETKKGKRRLWLAEDPEGLKEILERRKRRLEAEEKNLNDFILPALKAIDIHQENKPTIRFFEGLQGIYKVYDDYILKAHDVIGCGSYDSVMRISSLKVEKRYIAEMRRKNILYRGILEDTATNWKFDELSKGVMHNKFLPEGAKVTADVLVFGSYVALISYDRASATLIEDESIAKSLKLYLEFMWERL